MGSRIPGARAGGTGRHGCLSTDPVPRVAVRLEPGSIAAPMTLSGARLGRPTWWRRLTAAASAAPLAAFVAPGREVALAQGINLESAGLRLVANPRHADVLVLVGEIPPGLANAVALTYAQMPRPRAILAIGAGPVMQLPSADVTIAAIQTEVEAGVARLSELFRESAWTSH